MVSLLKIFEELQSKLCHVDNTILTEQISNFVLEVVYSLTKKRYLPTEPDLNICIIVDNEFKFTLVTPKTPNVLSPIQTYFLPENMIKEANKLITLKKQFILKNQKIKNYLRFLGNTCTTLTDVYKIAPAVLLKYLPKKDNSDLTLTPEEIILLKTYVKNNSILEEITLEAILTGNINE